MNDVQGEVGYVSWISSCKYTTTITEGRKGLYCVVSTKDKKIVVYLSLKCTMKTIYYLHHVIMLNAIFILFNTLRCMLHSGLEIEY